MVTMMMMMMMNDDFCPGLANYTRLTKLPEMPLLSTTGEDENGHLCLNGDHQSSNADHLCFYDDQPNFDDNFLRFYIWWHVIDHWSPLFDNHHCFDNDCICFNTDHLFPVGITKHLKSKSIWLYERWRSKVENWHSSGVVSWLVRS